MTGLKRPIQISSDIAFITLTQGYVAIIDTADIPLVSGTNWSALVCKRRKAVYAVRVFQKKMLLMHRIINSTPDHLQTDHRDGDGLNNRRYNLRNCTHADNQINKSVRSDNKIGIKGVCWDKKARHWKAEIQLHEKRKFLGYFDSAEDASTAYKTACIKLHGEFARLE